MGQLNLKNIYKNYGIYDVIKGIDLEVHEGEFVVFVGPSGCGKSTLLRMIAGLEDITSGDITIDGERVNNLAPVKRGISMVFQSYALYPHMTVYENIAFPLRVQKMAEPEVRARVEAAANILQLGERLQQKPGMLSGGQRQRVAIGRAIVREPKGFLFDEPLSNLDAALRVEMRFEIARLHETLGTTMIYVTHDQVEAMTLADRIVVLKDGKIMQIGSPRDLYEKPDNLFVAQFIGSPKMNILPCTGGDGKYAIEGHGGGALPDGTGDAPTSLGIRPEHIEVVAPGEGQVTGTVEIDEYLGSDTFLYVDCGTAGRLIVRVAEIEAGMRRKQVGLKFRPEKLHFFNDAGASI